MNILSKNLRYLMETHRINKNQLAKILSIPSMSIGRWVNGKVADPSLSKLLRLSNFFEVSIDNLILRNLEVQNEVARLYSEYVYVPMFEWNSRLIAKSDLLTNTIKIPKILNIGGNDNIFSIMHPSEYYGIFPKNAVLILSKSVNAEIHDVLLVRNKMLDNLSFIRYHENEFSNILTHEKVDISQYTTEGIIINMILDNVFLNIPK